MMDHSCKATQVSSVNCAQRQGMLCSSCSTPLDRHPIHTCCMCIMHGAFAGVDESQSMACDYVLAATVHIDHEGHWHTGQHGATQAISARGWANQGPLALAQWHHCFASSYLRLFHLSSASVKVAVMRSPAAVLVMTAGPLTTISPPLPSRSNLQHHEVQQQQQGGSRHQHACCRARSAITQSRYDGSNRLPH